MSQLTSSPNSQDDDILSWFELLGRQLSSARQRVLVSCQGSQQFCDQLFGRLQLQLQDLAVLSNRALISEAIPFTKSEVLIGLEFSHVIVDLFGGLNADVIAIAGGLVKRGGMLVLLSEKPSEWSIQNDLFAVWQNHAISPNAIFINYFFDQIAEHPQICLPLIENQALPKIPQFTVTQPTAVVDGKTLEQAEILKQVNTWLQRSDSKFTLITANRGRGKSVCLGMIAKELVKQHQRSVCVTAYSRASAKKLLTQLDAPVFVSPDALVENPVAADVLLIDEAAMLPYPILVQLCARHKQVIMATTTGGYEGTGQGFLLRFVARLPSSQLMHLEIQDPVRWSVNDNLEKWLDNCLLLNPVSNGLSGGDSTQCRFRVLTRVESQADIDLLLKIYRLMAAAHYRTRPSDLRSLMENPDLIIVLAEYDGEPTGVALLNAEGGFDESTCEEIFLGKRRPKGHLLAQMLTAQAGSGTFAQLRGLRIQRIAVLDSKRRLGIGRQLVKFSQQFAGERGYDYVGASFAFDSESAGFWKACDFSLAHISYGQGKSSGNHSVAVVNSMSEASSELLGDLHQRIQSCLPLWCCQYLRPVDCESVITLLRYIGDMPKMSQFEFDEVRAFGTGHRGFELCFVSLQKLVMLAVVRLPENFYIHPWLIEKIVQNRDWTQLSVDVDIVGRKARLSRLRKLIKQILQADVGLCLKPDNIDSELAER